MTDAWRWKLALAGALGVAAAVFLLGIDWGLPNRSVDPFLFGEQPPWNGKKILGLAGGWDENADRAADAARRPLGSQDKPLVLNQTDGQRAQILLRYRLYSYQPDEMVTFRALSGMRPTSLQMDPHLYQYGGLWVYPVGVLLKVAAVLGQIRITPDLTFYLDHPEQFGRFYVVARLYTAAWAMVGGWAVFAIVRRITRCWLAATSALLCYALLPVVVNMAHEAKPHLPGAVLALLTVLAAERYIVVGRARWWVLAGMFCGAAMGMVLTGVVAFGVLPVMALMRRDSWGRRAIVLLAGAGVGLATYILTNPYVPLNLFRGNRVLSNNVANYGNFYRFSDLLGGLIATFRAIAEGTSLWLAAAGMIGLAAIVLRGREPDAARSVDRTSAPADSDIGAKAGPVLRNSAGWLLAAPAILVVVQMAAFGSGKGGEYGRFGLLPDVGLMIAAVVAVARLAGRPALRGSLLVLLPLIAASAGGRYLGAFILDARPRTPRLVEAERIQQLSLGWPTTLATHAEPAPYCLPPVNLFEGWKLVLLPKGAEPVADDSVDMIVDAVDSPAGKGTRQGGYVEQPPLLSGSPTAISWAAKPFRVRVRDRGHGAATGGVR